MGIRIKDIAFIINPNSGKRKANKILATVKKYYPACFTVITQSAEEMDNFIKKYSTQYKVIVVSGGDGTVNRAAKLLAGKMDVCLAIYPTGSGNGFARELGFKYDLIKLFQDILSGNTIKIDLISVNGDICANVSGIGFDAHIAHMFDRESTRGLITYVKNILQSVFLFKSFYAEIAYNEKKIAGDFMLISFANTRQFGNNAIIAPEAKPNDDNVNMVLVKKMPSVLYPTFAFKMMTGKLKQNKYIRFIKTDANINVKTTFKQLHIDGEPKTYENGLNIKLSNDKLMLIKTRYNNI